MCYTLVVATLGFFMTLRLENPAHTALNQVANIKERYILSRER